MLALHELQGHNVNDPRKVLDRIRVRVCDVLSERVERVTDTGLPDKLQRGTTHPPEDVDVPRVALYT